MSGLDGDKGPHGAIGKYKCGQLEKYTAQLTGHFVPPCPLLNFELDYG